MTSYPAFDEHYYRDYEMGDGSLDPFARCEHALKALQAGDTETAIATLCGRVPARDLADRIGGEAESLIRSGLLADAERRLECAVSPKFRSLGAADRAYRAARRQQLKALTREHQTSLCLDSAA